MPNGGDNSKLPGMGGAYNSFNLGLYTYSHFNPVRYTDPDGKSAALAVEAVIVYLVLVAIVNSNPQKHRAGSRNDDGLGGASSGTSGSGSLLDKFKNLIFNESGESSGTDKGGAENAPVEVTPKDVEGWIYGPENDPKINPDGSTNPGKSGTWVSPDDFKNGAEATDKLDTYKPVQGRSPVVVPKGTEVKTGVVPGHKGPFNGSGGANEINIPQGLPKGSVGKWEPLE